LTGDRYSDRSAGSRRSSSSAIARVDEIDATSRRKVTGVQPELWSEDRLMADVDAQEGLDHMVGPACGWDLRRVKGRGRSWSRPEVGESARIGGVVAAEVADRGPDGVLAQGRHQWGGRVERRGPQRHVVVLGGQGYEVEVEVGRR
jgi:hypothetical protein